MHYVTRFASGNIGIITLGRSLFHDHDLAKTMYVLSDPFYSNGGFDPAIHTLEAIEAGVEGHEPLKCFPMLETDILPLQAQRKVWEATGKEINLAQFGS